jgi:enterochelin esterase family protein
VILDGELYRDRVQVVPIIRDLAEANRLPPLTCVYVAAESAAARHAELTCSGPFTRFLVDELIPWTEGQLGTHSCYWLCGLSLSGLAAAYAAIQHPEIFRGAVCQSPSAWWHDEWLATNLPVVLPSASRYWISVGNQEIDEDVSHPPTGLLQRTSQLASCNKLALSLAEHGATVRYSGFAGGHDPACWAKELPAALDWLLENRNQDQ